MGNRLTTSAAPGASAAKAEPHCKICCACPAERRVRDECLLFKGQDQCEKELGNFYNCLLASGFSQAEVDSLRRNTRTSPA